MRAAAGIVATCALFAAVPVAARGAEDPPVQSNTRQPQAVPPDALERQRQMVSSLPDATVAYDDLGGVRRLTGRTGLYLSDPSAATPLADPGAEALDLLGPMFLATGSERLTLRGVRDLDLGERLIVYEQSIRGIPVVGGLAVTVEAETGHITGLNASFLPDRRLPEAPVLKPAEARRRLEAALVGSTFAQPGSVSIEGTPSLAYVKSREDGQPALVWLVDAAYTSPDEGARRQRFWVHAVSGRVEGKASLDHSLFDGVWTAAGGTPALGLLPVGVSPLNTADPHAQAAIANLAVTELVFSQLGIPSIGPVRFLLNYGQNRPSSSYGFINGKHWIIMGNGGYVPMPLNRDAVAHEWGHAFYSLRSFQVPSILNYEGDAIAEAFADLAAVVTDAAVRGGPSYPTWQIAEGIDSTGFGLRSWTYPQSGPHPTHDWYPHRDNQGDPHKNSTIIGHAFYLLSVGGPASRAGQGWPVPYIPVPGLGFERAREIFLNSIGRGEFFNPNSFFDVKHATTDYAAMLDSFYPGERNADATSLAWLAVGVGHGCTIPPIAPPFLNIEDFLCRGRFRFTWAPLPDATTYHAQIVPAGWPWELARAATDGPVTECGRDISEPMRIRIRACNGCGCSAFTLPDFLPYTRTCM
jgi:Zn-dependent metalloprotease